MCVNRARAWFGGMRRRSRNFRVTLNVPWYWLSNGDFVSLAMEFWLVGVDGKGRLVYPLVCHQIRCQLAVDPY